MKQLACHHHQEPLNPGHSQATNSTAWERGQAVAVLQGRATALAANVAEGNDGALRVVDLDTLPVHAGRGTEAGVFAAQEAENGVVSV